MDWKKAAIDDLKNYSRRKDSLENIRVRIRALKDDYTSVKCALGSDIVPVSGGSSRIEDRMLNNIAERERLKLTYRAAKPLVDLTEKGLDGIDERERRVLELFYVSPAKGNVERLCEELGYEQSKIYRIKDQALYKFTVQQYGIADY